jgi:hypothetical protein
MGYFRRKAELTADWHPTRALFKQSLYLFSLSLGFVLMIVMIFDLDIYDLWGGTGVGTTVLYYFMLGMIALMMYLNTLLVLKNERLRWNTRDMVVREFDGPDMARVVGVVRDALDEGDHPFIEEELQRNIRFLLSDEPLILNRFVVRHGDLTIMIGNSIVTGHPFMIVGPKERFTGSRYEDLKGAIETALVGVDIPIIEVDRYQEYYPSSPLR